MGLDIYCYKIKNLTTWKKYKTASIAYNTYNNDLWNKYEKETTKAYNKWCKWFNSITAKLDKHPNDKTLKEEYEKDPYSYKLTDFTTKEETQKYTLLNKQYESAKNDCWYIEQQDLYMRKHYWFIQWVYSKTPFKAFKHDKTYNVKILEDKYAAILTKKDIYELISKLRKVCYLPDTYIYTKKEQIYDITAQHAVEKDVEYINEEKVNEIFPILDDYIHFARPDWNYCKSTFVYYLTEYEKLYNDMNDDELLFIDESW